MVYFEIIIYIAGLAMVIIGLNYLKARQTNAFLKFVASQKGIVFREKIWEHHKGILLGDLKISDGFKVARQDGLHRYYFDTFTGQGRNKVEQSVFCFEMPVKSNHLVLKSHLSNIMSSVMPLSRHRYKAEGLFGEAFDIYMTSGSQSKTLSMLGPDELATILTHFSDCDFEIIGNQVYIIGTRKGLENSQLSDWLGQTNLLADEFVSDAMRRGQSAEPDTIMDAEPLKRRMTPFKILTAVIVFIPLLIGFIMYFLNFRDVPSLMGVIVNIISIGIVIWSFYLLARQNRLRGKIKNWTNKK
ncbi:hypothetical protein KBC99_00075 [Candidatus Saccharibacteria bacterium]|nr:hypothetical protein [Candidatus Saccharibacteria bacterium]